MQPGSTITTTTTTTISSPPSKRLLFDRRYGWVLDEWREPSEEALSGGRGMFCIVPLTKALLVKASETINMITSSTLKVLEIPDLLSPKFVQSTLNDEVHNIASSVKHIDFSLIAPKIFAVKSTCPSDMPEEH